MNAKNPEEDTNTSSASRTTSADLPSVPKTDPYYPDAPETKKQKREDGSSDGEKKTGEAEGGGSKGEGKDGSSL